MYAHPACKVESYFVRPRSAIAVYGTFAQLHGELDLHILSQGLDYDPFARQVLADGLSALALHLSTRGPEEYVGWTVQFQEPLMNLFFSGSGELGSVVGRAFLDEEDLEPREENVFYSQSQGESRKPRLSSVAVRGVDLFGIVEQFYQKSEQQLGRYFHQEGEVAFLAGLPNVDARWIESVGTEEVFSLPAAPRVEPLSNRPFRFRCGCDTEKVAGILVGAYGTAADILFQDADSVEVECPRCAARLVVSREAYERTLRERSRRE